MTGALREALQLSFISAEHHESTGGDECILRELKKKMVTYLPTHTPLPPKKAYEVHATGLPLRVRA